MYQSLIWPELLGHQPGRLRAALDAEKVKGATDALVDSMRRDAELDGDFLRRQMLVDEPQAIELALAESGYAPGNLGIGTANGRPVRLPLILISCEINLHQHDWPFTAKSGIKQSGAVNSALTMRGVSAAPPVSPALAQWWRGLDSNQRRAKPGRFTVCCL